MNFMSLSSLAFSGVWCPTVTPFSRSGDLDFDALATHFARLTASGIDGILLSGSIGEFTALSIGERFNLIRTARQLSTMPMIANVSTTVLDDMMRLSDVAFETGYGAVMVLPHYYFGQTTGQLREYFRAIGRRLPGRWLIYNFPARTGCDIGAELLAELVQEFPNLVGIKDTVDCQSHTRMLIQAVRGLRQDFAVFAGYDEYLMMNWLAGGAGVISGLNNLVPQRFAEMRQAFVARDFATLAEKQAEIGRLSAIYTIGDDFVTTIKTAVARKFGSMSPQSRSFGGELDAAGCAAIDALLSAY